MKGHYDLSKNYLDKSITIRHRNVEVLALELYKVHYGFAPKLINDIFLKKEMWRTILEMTLHLKQEMLNLFIAAQKQNPF